jgi:hypothetical protein
MTTKEYLMAKYGQLMILDEVAQELRRTPNGLEFTLSARKKVPWVKELRSTIVRIGRRRLFRSEGIAKIMEGGIE